MNKQKKLIIALLFVLLFISSLVLFAISIFKKESVSFPLQSFETKEKIFYEKIPGSKFHNPDATWWGYNQNKIARFDNLVFMYIIENTDDSNKTLSNLVVYKKDGDSRWEKGASFPTSRPGNILVDSSGVLHVFVFEPTNVALNDSLGKLVHYFFPNSRSGDITNYQQEIVVEAKENIETVNIRVGSAISQDDTMVVGFGLTTYNPLYKGHSEHVYYKKPENHQWTHLIAGENLGHDFYYPFVIATRNGFHLLSVQDDFNDDGNPATYDNIYQKIIYFEYQNGTWNKEIIADLTKHSLASSRPRLLEQSDLFVDSIGKVHVFYKEFLDANEQWKTTKIWHLSKESSNWERKELNIERNNIGWVRLFETEGKLYYLGTSWNEVYLSTIASEEWVKLDAPKDVKAIYPYIATNKGGTKDTEKYIDVLLLGADQREYNTTSHYYLRIPKSELLKSPLGRQ